MNVTVRPVEPVTMLDSLLLNVLAPDDLQEVDAGAVEEALRTLGLDVDLEVRQYIVSSPNHPYAMQAGFTVPPERSGGPFWLIAVAVDAPARSLDRTLWHELGHVKDATERADAQGISPADLYEQDSMVYASLKEKYGEGSKEYMDHYFVDLPAEAAAEAVADEHGHVRLTKTKEVLPVV